MAFGTAIEACAILLAFIFGIFGCTGSGFALALGLGLAGTPA